MDIDYKSIDEGIRPAVKHFNQKGYPTIASCEGGEGHGFERPMIRFMPRGDSLEAYMGEIASEIQGKVSGFTVSLKRYYTSEVKEAKDVPYYTFIEVEFWNKEVLQNFNNSIE